MSTIAENWIQQGLQQGLRQGLQQGIVQGRRQGLLDAIDLGLKLRFGSAGLRLLPDYTLNDAEMNTYACAWHHNLTAAVCSFRAAKALCTNPGSRHAVQSFRWRYSEQFTWSDHQLMTLGFIEPGQWF